MPAKLEIVRDIRHAQTLPGSFYSNAEALRCLREVFARSWQFIGDEQDVRTPGLVSPLRLLPGFLDEPLVLTRDLGDELHCLSNVCTHRGVLVAEGRCHAKALKCRYHGRSFGLDGGCLGMPEFDEVVGFPSPSDDLPRLELGKWGGLLFTHLGSEQRFEDFIAPVDRYLGGLGFAESGVAMDSSLSRDYQVQAHWALYCDNYLESFHVPFVHRGLAQTLDYRKNDIVLFDGGSLQVGFTEDRAAAFDLPATSTYADRLVAAFYFFLFPNLMLNFYPWGLSLNLVEPLSVERTRIRFRAYVHHPEKLDRGAGSDLDRVEREDEEVVESAQQGTRSRLYQAGRFSPTQERAVHHFHRQLAEELNVSGFAGLRQSRGGHG